MHCVSSAIHGWIWSSSRYSSGWWARSMEPGPITMVSMMKPNNEPGVDSTVRSTTGSGQALPGGTTAKQRTITAVITAIDNSVPSISFKGSNGWTYSSRVQDTEALAKVKVGDRVDIVWTEAMLVSLEPGA